MEELVNQIKEVRYKLSNGDLSVTETIVLLSELIDTFNTSEDANDSEKGYLRSLLKSKKVAEIKSKGDAAKKRVKNLKILMLLHDFGFDQLTEVDIINALPAN